MVNIAGYDTNKVHVHILCTFIYLINARIFELD